MIHLRTRLPTQCIVAFSGGSDSTFACDFLRRTRRVHTLLFVDHGTPFSAVSLEHVKSTAEEVRLPLIVREIRGRSEHEWARQRWRIFNEMELPVVTGHHFEDALEWWIYTALRGNPRVMPATHGNVLRPFLATPKSEIRRWLAQNNLTYMDDPTNTDGSNMRAKLRDIMPALDKAVPAMRAALRRRMSEDSENIEAEGESGEESGAGEELDDDGGDELDDDGGDELDDDDDEGEGDDYADPGER